jgi:hypothetical protein
MPCILDNGLNQWPLCPEVLLAGKDTVHAAPLVRGDCGELTVCDSDSLKGTEERGVEETRNPEGKVEEEIPQ